MEDEKSILELISDNLYDMSGKIEINIKKDNKTYADVAERINHILKENPKIANIELAKTGLYYELDELEAMYELHLLRDTKKVLELHEYYLKGMRDCFEFLVPLLDVDIKKIEKELKCQ